MPGPLHQARRRPSARVRRNRLLLGSVTAAVVLAATVAVLRPSSGEGTVQTAVGAGSSTTRSSTVGTVRPGAQAPAAATATPATTAAAPADRSVAVGSGQPVTFAFGGDVHFEGQIRSKAAANPSSILAGVRTVLAGADVAMVNLETAVTVRGTPAAGKQYTFRAPAKAFAVLQAGGVDVATMANNHGLDYGQVGLRDSLDAARAAAFPVVGIGLDEDGAFAPWRTTVNGQRIAVIGATQVIDDELVTAWTATSTQAGLASAKHLDRLVRAVTEARATSDTVVVYLHWGTESTTCPNAAQPALARSLVDAGADIVVGSHAHRLVGGGRLDGALVDYGLGNFVFYTSAGPGTESGVLTVTATGRRIDAYQWHAGRLVGQLPTLLGGAAATTAAASWAALRSCANLGP